MRKALAIILAVSVLFVTSCHRESECMLDACAALEDVFGASELPGDREYPRLNENLYYVSPQDRRKEDIVRTIMYIRHLSDVMTPSEGPYAFVTVIIEQYKDESSAEALHFYSSPDYMVNNLILDGVKIITLHCSLLEGDTRVAVEFDFSEDIDISYIEQVLEFCDEMGMDHPDISELVN